MAVRSFTGYLNTDLFGGQNPTGGATFDLSTEPTLNVLLQDGDTDTVAEGDGPAQELSSDPQGDQLAFVQNASGTVLIDGSEFFLESTFTFTIDGQTFTGYHFEQEGGAGLDFTIFPPDLPAGTATVTSVNFFPSPDSVPYDTLASGDEEIDDRPFANLDLSGDDTIEAGDGEDTILAGAGNDTIEAGDGDDTIFAGAGNDDIDGGAGADTIYGDGGPQGTDFSAIPDPSGDGTPIDDGDDLSAGFTVTAGATDVNFTFVDDGQATDFDFNNSDAQVTTGLNDGFGATNDAIFLAGSGNGETSTTTISFTQTGTATSTEVTGVNFRINDIDTAGWRDIVTIRAFDADGNPVEVTLTAGSGMTLSDTDGVPGNDTATSPATPGNVFPGTASGSLLVEIAGPVSTIEIDYGNLGNGGQRIDLTEIFFDGPVADDGSGFDDTITGGAGDDTIFGELGNDTITGDAGADTIDGGVGDDDISGGDNNDVLDGGAGTDTVSGDAGDDTIVISAGTDTIDGGTGADTFTAQGGSSLTDETITVVVDEFGNGTIVKTNDGTTDTFTSIETLIADEASEEADSISLTEEGVLVGEVSGIDDTAVGLFFPKDGSGPIAFGGAGEPTFSELLAGTGVPDLGPGGTYQISSGDESGTVGGISFENFENIEFAVVCFADGTLIRTDTGLRPVEDLTAGDRVITRDNGPQTIRWVGSKPMDAATLASKPHLRPIRISAGALGRNVPSTDLIVSPQHRILLRSKIAIRMFDTEEILVPAKHLLGLDGISVATDVTDVVYHHIMCDRHEVVEADGAWAETLHTGPEALKALGPDALTEITEIFGTLPCPARPLARPTPKGRQVRQMVARHQRNRRPAFDSGLTLQ